MSLRKNLLLASTLALGFTGTASALTVVGVTNSNQLVSFTDTPAQAASLRALLSGFTAGDTRLVGIDYRVQDGSLYGVGNAGGVYKIDDQSGAMTYLHTLSVALEGSQFTIDFNPAADRLRIHSNSGQNLRHNVGTGITLLDAPLNYAPGAPLNSIGPVVTSIVASAYTNNDLSATTGTTLFAIDATLNQLALVSPPNNGSMAVVGQLGVDVGNLTSFDIVSTNVDGATDANLGVVITSTGPNSATVYTLNLLTGKLSTLASITGNTAAGRLIGIAAPLGQ